MLVPMTHAPAFDMDERAACAVLLNPVFHAAKTRLTAHPSLYGEHPALRITYAGLPLASPQADLKGPDRRNLASAFIKAGFHTGESAKLALRHNGPALVCEAYTPPADMLWTVERGYINPWTIHLLRPDAAYLRTVMPELDAALRLRFS